MKSNVREFVRKGQTGPNGKLGNSITLEARKAGAVVQRLDLPAEEPLPVFMFMQQCLGAMAAASQQHPKKRLVMGVVPNWKAWVIRHILRAL